MIAGWRILGPLRGRPGCFRATDPTGAPMVIATASGRRALPRFTERITELAAAPSPNIVTIRAHGSDSRYGPFVAYPPVPGDRLREQPGPARALDLVADALAGVAALHALGIAHGRLTPESFVLDGDVMVLEAILEPFVEAGDDWPRFRAPEQLDGARADERSDVYAMGAILAYLAGESEVTRRATARHPMRRFADAAEMRAALVDTIRIPAKPARYVPRDPVEAGLVDRLRDDPRDAATRAVYADHLEQLGDRERAAYLRRGDDLQAWGADPAGAAWRAIVARAVVVCPRDGCPTWDAMTPTDDDTVRRCAGCRRTVHYCCTPHEETSRRVRAQVFACDASVHGSVEDMLREHNGWHEMLRPPAQPGVLERLRSLLRR